LKQNPLFVLIPTEHPFPLLF